MSNPLNLARGQTRESWAIRHLPRRTSPNGFIIVREQQDTTVRVKASGELDIATAAQLSDCCARELGRDGTQLVVVDLAAVTFMDCSGLQMLLVAHERHRGRLRIIVSPVVARMIDMTGVRRRLPIIEESQASGPILPGTSLDSRVESS